jgi:hypothetical protein
MPDQDAPARAPLAPELVDYRKHLVAAEQKSQEDFDKTVLSLSGGALGISFVFLKDVVGPKPIDDPHYLFFAWIAWGLSTTCVLSSYFMSHLALRRAIKQVDEGTIWKQKAGGSFRTATAALNASGAVLFLVGVCSITLFASANLSQKGVQSGNTPSTTSAAPTTSAGSAATSAPRPGGK